VKASKEVFRFVARIRTSTAILQREGLAGPPESGYRDLMSHWLSSRSQYCVRPRIEKPMKPRTLSFLPPSSTAMEHL